MDSQSPLISVFQIHIAIDGITFLDHPSVAKLGYHSHKPSLFRPCSVCSSFSKRDQLVSPWVVRIEAARRCQQVPDR